MATKQTTLDQLVGEDERVCACGKVKSIYTWPQHAAQCSEFSLDDDDFEEVLGDV